MGQHTPLFQLFLDLQGSGGLAGAGGTGQQDDGACREVVQDGVRCLADLVGVLSVARLQKALHILVDAAVDLL